MPCISYEPWTPNPADQALVDTANVICADYSEQGYDLTLRQLYYQFVARDLIPNTQQSYKRLGSVISKARMAGLLDWRYIVDRTRNLRGVAHWDDPGDIMHAAASSFRLDKWADQNCRIEVWVEKEALAGVVQRAAEENDVQWFSCRGYTSLSEVWAAGQRLLEYVDRGFEVLILHLGDHDPSGIDMTRDIRDRLKTFMGDAAKEVEVRRIALNMDQIEQYEPPPNPAKLTDSRATGYIRRFGRESWELDALDPATLHALIAEHIASVRVDSRYASAVDVEDDHRRLLRQAARRWNDVAAMLDV
jgi:hypothetical protein